MTHRAIGGGETRLEGGHTNEEETAGLEARNPGSQGSDIVFQVLEHFERADDLESLTIGQAIDRRFLETATGSFNARASHPGRSWIGLDPGIGEVLGKTGADRALAGANFQHGRAWRNTGEGAPNHVVAHPCVQSQRRERRHGVSVRPVCR
jgi:hypothetical protein